MSAGISKNAEGRFISKNPIITIVIQMDRRGMHAEGAMWFLSGPQTRKGYMRYNRDNEGIMHRALQNVILGVKRHMQGCFLGASFSI